MVTFAQKRDVKKPNKTQKKTLRWVFLGGFFIANPDCN
jgi:hypothetical protein